MLRIFLQMKNVKNPLTISLLGKVHLLCQGGGGGGGGEDVLKKAHILQGPC